MSYDRYKKTLLHGQIRAYDIDLGERIYKLCLHMKFLDPRIDLHMFLPTGVEQKGSMAALIYFSNKWSDWLFWFVSKPTLYVRLVNQTLTAAFAIGHWWISVRKALSISETRSGWGLLLNKNAYWLQNCFIYKFMPLWYKLMSNLLITCFKQNCLQNCLHIALNMFACKPARHSVSCYHSILFCMFWHEKGDLLKLPKVVRKRMN